MWTSAYFSEYQDEKCGPPPAIVLGQDSRGSNQFFDDVNLKPITLQIHLKRNQIKGKEVFIMKLRKHLDVTQRPTIVCNRSQKGVNHAPDSDTPACETRNCNKS